VGKSPSRGAFLNIITFYADCSLPDEPRKNQDGFNWRKAVKMMAKSGERFGYRTLVVTDSATDIEGPWLRVGNARAEGLMMWLLRAQHAAICASTEPSIMVSPDTLIAKPLNFLMGFWDLALLTRRKPKPIINSVIAFKPTPAVASLWSDIVILAAGLPQHSRDWGADIDAVVDSLAIQFNEDSTRQIDGVCVRLLPMEGKFQSVRHDRQPHHMQAPLWDFKGSRKRHMRGYARLLNAHI
jgi:hypothetical protein